MPISFRFAILFVLMIPAALPALSQAPVPRYGKFEASWTLPDQTGNPFDPSQNDIQVAVHLPEGGSVRVPAFWDGDRWRVRYAPLKTGRYTLVVLRGGTVVHPADLTASTFRCVPSSSPGFVRRDPAQVQRFQFDDRRAFYPFGMDQAWGGAGLLDYPQVFQVMHENGLNWARVWMDAWDGKNLEWDPDKAKTPPIGQYDLSVARKWDTIMDAADRSGVYVQMVLQHHGEYTARTDPNWSDNPFNAANGGFLQRPEDFFTNAEARRLTRAKYRYIVARWGYSTHLMAFELFNEVQNIGEVRAHFENVVAWHKEMAAYIRALDGNHHLLTTSNSPPDDPLAKIGLDYDQVHTYNSDMISFNAGFTVAGLDVPIFVGEWGASGAQSEPFLHDGLWSGLMVPSAGAPQFWFWDQVQRKNWWPQFRSVSRYIAASGIAQARGLRAVPAQEQDASARADLTFTPTKGWGNATTSDVTVSSDGRIRGLGGIPSFIQGSAHRDMMPKPTVFHLDCARPCRFEMLVGTVAKAGARPQLSLDGKLGAEKELASAEQDHDAAVTLSLEVPAGPHLVALDNIGADWFTVRRFTVTDYAAAIGVLAKGNPHAAFFWAYNRDRSGSAFVTGTIAFPSLKPGIYDVRFWDTGTGQPLGSTQVLRVRGGVTTVTLPPFRADIAGYVLPPKAL